MIHELIPWRDLTRFGIPALKVALRPLVVDSEVTVNVGEVFNAELFPQKIRAERLRQFYEQRRLEPVDGPKTLRELREEQFRRRQGATIAETVEPVTPVASQIVAGLPGVEVAVERPSRPKPKPKGRR